jgi:membrane protease YdiL (CAAX protease family)
MLKSRNRLKSAQNNDDMNEYLKFEKMKKLTNWISISCIALIVLGIIHLTATIMILPMFQNLAKEQLTVFLFMYLAAGMGTILPGLISKLLIKGLKNKDKRAWEIILICSIYSTLIGIGGIITMINNPFAYLGLLIGISLLIPTLLIKKEIK